MPRATFSFSHAVDLLENGHMVQPAETDSRRVYLVLNNGRLDLYNGYDPLRRGVHLHWKEITGKWRQIYQEDFDG